MGEDDVLRQLLDSSRIMEEHSYYKMENNTLPYAKRIEVLTLKQSSLPLDKDKPVNGLEKSIIVAAKPMTKREKIVKKKARVEDIIKNLKKGKTVVKKPTKLNNENSSFVSMCTIREEHDDIEEDLPPLKPTTEQTTGSTVYLNNATPPQTILQNKNQMPFNTVPAGNANNNTTPVQTQRKVLLIQRPGAPPLYLNIQDNPASSNITLPTGTNVMNSGNEGGKAQPLIIQYRLPYPNNTCKVVGSPPNQFLSPPDQNPGNLRNLLCRSNETFTFNKQPGLTTAIRVEKPLEIPVNFAGNQRAYVTTIMPEDQDMLLNEQTTFTPPPGTKSKISSKNKKADYRGTAQLGRPLGNIIMENATKTVSERRGDSPNISKTNSSGQIKSTQPRHVLPNVRVSNRKKHRTEKALMMDKKKKRKPNKRNEMLQLRYAKKGLKTKQQVEIKTEHRECIINNVGNSQNPHHDNSQGVDTSSGAENESGNLYRDPALLTREERALQRALMLFKEMENKKARKTVVHNEQTNKLISVKSKRNIRKRMKFKQLHVANVELLRKRKLVNNANDTSFVKRRKMNVEQQATQSKIVQLANTLARKAQENVNLDKKAKKRPRTLNDDDTKASIKHRRKILGVNTIKDKNIEPVVKSPKRLKATHSTTQLKSPQITQIKSPPMSPLLQLKSPTTLVRSPVTEIKPSLKNVKSPPVQQTSTKPEKSKDAHDKHRVKTYMLIPSYRGFQDFSPVLLGSRTRNKKVELVKSDSDDNVSCGVKQVETKKDVPLLVIETVNNKAVKQDVVVKDKQLRNLVTNSLRAQGMLKKDLEKEDEFHFENREKRNITVNRNTGETVLHKAARMGYDETVYHSIQQGCNSNAKDYAGWTPLHEACSRGHSDVVKVLVKYNADVNSCSNDGIRPIHDAADNGNTDSLRLLIAYGADPLLSTYSGRTCLDCAKNTKSKDYVKGCIGDLYLTDERNSTVDIDYEDRWEFRGSCSVLDKDAKYMSGIFDNIPAGKRASTSVEFEWSDTPHLTTYNLPLKKDGVITGRKNYVRFQDLQERLGKSRSTVIRLLKRTEIREVPWSEFFKEVSKSCFNKLFEAPVGDGTEEVKVEMVPLNWNVRFLLKVKRENISL